MRTISWQKKGSKGEIYDCTVKVIDKIKTIVWIDCTCDDFINRRIKKVGQFSDIKYFFEPCKHLKPVVEALEKQGYTLKRPKPMEGTDKCTAELRRKIMERSGGICEMLGCGHPGIEIHRKIPKTNGGKYNEDNCILLCLDCHHNITFQKWQGTPGAKND